MAFLLRIRFTYRLIALALFPFLGFLTFTVLVVLDNLKEKSITERMENNILFMTSISALMDQLQKERGMSAVYLNQGLEKAAVDTQRKETDKAMDRFQENMAKAALSQQSLQQAADQLQKLFPLRQEVDMKKISSRENIERYSTIIDQLLALDNHIVNTPTTKGVGKLIGSINILELAKENSGKLRATMSSLLAADRPIDFKDFQRMVGFRSKVESNLDSPALVLSKEGQEKLGRFRNSNEWKEIDRVYELMVQKVNQGGFGVDGAAFFKTITVQVENIGELVNTEIDWIVQKTRTFRRESTAKAWTLIISLSIIAGLLIILTYAVIRSIADPLERVSKGLSMASENVSSASKEIASASNSLAEGATEQAATIQETAASLEEIASMVKRNAENAVQANGVMSEAKHSVSDAQISMNRLSQSMEEIAQASNQTQKIIKTIDEIAFQTNLLALNAAVEAARAGEAGAGFAVVADEVRNLARRSAEAARSTNDLIEATVIKVKDGYHVMHETVQVFTKVAEGAEHVAVLLAEITAASKEQATGVDQLNQAVSEMDKVTQQNAASSEQTAASSEELSAQAQQLREMVNELMAVLGKNGTPSFSGLPRNHSINSRLRLGTTP